MRCANEAIQREKIPIPTVDEVLEELNRSTVFSKLDMNMGFIKLSWKKVPGISPHSQLATRCFVTRGQALV